MSATAKDLPGASLDETIDYADSGRERPSGADDMPKNPAPGNNRFVFTSGARPLDGYTIKRAIGRGGFGEVYYATSDSGKEVALKYITRNVDVERRGVAQCMNLKCPNLLSIHDIRANDSGETFVVMEYVSGPSLASVLEKNPGGMPPGEIRAWLKGIVEGVGYLHDHGIVHRDLKPANIFMEEGIVKIGDYGLSKMISPTPGSQYSESVGTCHYMAPELSTGKYHYPIDIYATGVILYEMITGRVPFDGESVGEVLMKHLTSRPDLSSIEEPYRTIVGRALAKDPNLRPARAVELLLPEDAPKGRDVRFIGDGKVAPPIEPPAKSPKDRKAKEDDVLRIGEEEPVFYIGPDTRPPAAPGRRRGFIPPIRWMCPDAKVVRDRRPLPPRAQPVARPAPPQPARAKTPAPPPPPPPLPPTTPSPRLRVAELSGSMLAAAPVAAILCVPIALTSGMDVSRRPQDIAFIFLTALVGAWGILAANKLYEGKSVDPVAKRLTYLVLGLVLGFLAQAFSQWTYLSFPKGSNGLKVVADGIGFPIKLDVPGMMNFATFFGIAYFANGWWKVTDRDRESRFRLGPIIASMFIGMLCSSMLPFSDPWGAGILGLTSAVLQLVSPWDRNASAYAAYVRRTGGAKKPKTATA